MFADVLCGPSSGSGEGQLIEAAIGRVTFAGKPTALFQTRGEPAHRALFEPESLRKVLLGKHPGFRKFAERENLRTGGV